ncbi:MAG: undecaprenyl-phosphate glucose phosphotransferase [Chloroflexota bacterium]|nr:MAG: undecaprenyl-phosphate glucose phosphotransferase [Chloroflexota bacterium]
MRRRAEFVFTATLLLLDVALISLAFYAAYLVTFQTSGSTGPTPDFISFAPMIFSLIVSLTGVYFFYRLYHQRRGESRIDEIYKLVPATSIGVIVATALTTVLYRDLEYPRLLLVYVWVFTLLFVGVGRLIHGALRSLAYARGWGELRVLIVGAGEAGNLILEKIRQSPRLGYRPIAFLDDEHVGRKVLGLPVVAHPDDLGDVVRTLKIDEVIVALPDASHQELLSIVSKCEDGRVSIKVFPDVFQIMAAEINIGDLSGLPLLAMRDVALRGWRLTLKRFVDLVISGAFLVFASPFLLLLAFLVKIDSRGPALFTQVRMGLDAKPFPIFKFRSMRVDAEKDGPGWTTEHDPRVTRVGHFMRRLSLDEFPQFINVFLGHMSLVGPRPEQPAFVEQFRELVPRYMERHREKAGITGWAQINGLRGDTSISERTKYDLYYIENWSLWFDFKILILTALKFFRDRSAY